MKNVLFFTLFFLGLFLLAFVPPHDNIGANILFHIVYGGVFGHIMFLFQPIHDKWYDKHFSRPKSPGTKP